MERYSFATYLVDEFNQEAFSLCHDIANLTCEQRQPVVLVGDAGTGKTHLLYSIVGRIRSTTDSTGLAYVTANDFPKAVQDLVEHPKPVQEATNAVLLVDQLESFTDNLEVLENVVRLFLDCGHSVICASRTNVGRLDQLPGGFANMLDNGHHVSILPQNSPTRIELLEQIIRLEHDQVITRLENELAELKQFLTSTSESHESEADEESLLLGLRKELELTRTELNLYRAKESSGGNAQAMDSSAVQELLTELEQLQGENSLNSVAAREAEGLRARVERLETERDELRIRLSESKATGPVLLDTEASGEPPSAEEARALVARAEHLVQEMQSNREEFSRSQELHTRQLEEIHELEKIFQQHEQTAGGSEINLPQLREQQEKWKSSVAELEQERDDLNERIVYRQTEIEKLTTQCETQREQIVQLQEELSSKTEAIVSMDLSLEDARKKESVASLRVNNQIQQYESRIAELESIEKELTQNESHLFEELQKIDGSLSEAAAWIRSAVDAYELERQERKETDSSLLEPELAELDTLEGGELLERMELERLDTQGSQEVDDAADEPPETPTIPVATLHHVEEIKHNISMLTRGEVQNPEPDIQSGLGNS